MHDSGELHASLAPPFPRGFSERSCPSQLVHHKYLSGWRSQSIIRHIRFILGCSHKGHCSELKEPPSSFFLRFFLWTVQHVAAISTRTSPTINRITETTLVCGRSLYVYVTPVPATPITNEMIPNGKMQRYQDFSIPPVACDSLSRDDSTSGTLGAPSCGWPSRVGGAVVCGWQVKFPVVHPILRLDAGNTTIKMHSV